MISVRTRTNPRYDTASLTDSTRRFKPAAAEFTTRSMIAPTTGSDATMSPTLWALDSAESSSRSNACTPLGSGGICSSPE